MIHLKTYKVLLCNPTLYEIEAESEQEAQKKAIELYKKEHNTWIDPEVHDAQKWQGFEGASEEKDEDVS